MPTTIDGLLGVSNVAPNSIDLIDLKVTLPFTKEYVSAQQTITLGGLLTLPHGLAATPKIIQVQAVCLTAESGFTVGQQVLLTGGPDGTGVAAGYGLQITRDATNILIRVGSAGLAASFNNTTGAGSAALTAANWRLIVGAWA